MSHRTRLIPGLLAAAFLIAAAPPRPATASTNVQFATGSLIIPMDTDYQDNGMLGAFGLVVAVCANNA